MILADMGAEVLRVISSSRPDLVSISPPYIPGTEISAAEGQLGRNKRLMTINLKAPRAIEIIHRLIDKYDILIEQFRPGVMAKFKLDYDSLKMVNPDIIYCSLTGYGQTGPMKSRAGHDIDYIARSGVASYSGSKEKGPILGGMQIADLAAGSNNAVMGILAAVIYRNSTGKGQHIDISMTDGMIAFTGYYGAGFLVDGKNLELEGGLTYGGSLYDYYRTKDGQYIAFGGLEPQFYTNFFKVINRPDLIPGGVMPDNVYEVKKEIRTIILTKTKDEWMILFNATDACVEPVMTFSEVFSDALVKERGMVVEVPLPNGGTVRQVAFPIKFSESQPSYRRVGVSIKSGTHTKEVCRELGYSENEIEEFERTGLFS
jgi:crotonobetainyl-CoA:carnitine CoA-transferase CaiB-like acyl-CoA transferase